MNVLITGVSVGLGLGMARAAHEFGAEVYGLSRRACPLDIHSHVKTDLSDLQGLPSKMETLLSSVDHLEVVILNAGQLGPLAYLKDQNLETLESLMDVNVWSNKVLVDWVLKNVGKVDQVVMISSGASIHGHAGWGGYAISKAALNMLVKLYASETPQVHFCSLAPGIIDTEMQDYLCNLEDLENFPSLERLREARGSEAMPTPEVAGLKIWKALPELKNFPSGSYQDIRKLSSE